MGKIVKRVERIVLCFILVCNAILTESGITIYAEEGTLKIYFIDSTYEKWIENDDAVMVLIDNSHNHKSYSMELLGKYTWIAEVPESTDNITFNRYDKSKTIQWNSFSAGSMDGKNIYIAQGSEYGYWVSETDYGFKEGDSIYLDVTEFQEWTDKNDTKLYANFMSATKAENGGNDISIGTADSTFYKPYTGLEKIQEHIYRYTVTYENAGNKNLRFWRGNDNTLWNCSNILKYSDFLEGNNCIKVLDWSDVGSLYRYNENKQDEKDIGEAYFKKPMEEDVALNEETGIVYVKNQVLVSALPGADKIIFEDIAKEIGAEIVGYIELSNDYQLEFAEYKNSEELENIIAYLNSLSFISYASLNVVSNSEPEMITNDYLYNDGATCMTGNDDSIEMDSNLPDIWDENIPDGDNWGLEALRIPSAWDKRDSFRPVKVGIYDGDFSLHEDLVYEKIFNNSKEVKDGHGTHVAGIIAAETDNNIGISGVATDTKLYAYSIDGKSDVESSMESKYAYATLIGNNVKVINVSLGEEANIQYAASHGIKTAINYITAEADILGEFFNKLILNGYDFVIVTSAGNTENDEFVYDRFNIYKYRTAKAGETNTVSGGVEAFYDCELSAITNEAVKSRILVVGAVDHVVWGDMTSYSYTDFSNIGERVDVCAPGVKILSTVPKINGGTGYALQRGTSMASPYIAGIAALMYQINPSIKATQVKEIICNSCYTTVSDSYGNIYGIPDASVCVSKAENVKVYDDDHINMPSGILTGTVTDQFTIPLSGVKITACRTSVGESNMNDYYTVGITDKDGNYEMVLPQGTYDLQIHAKGYMPFTYKGIIIKPDETLYMENMVLSVWIGGRPVSYISGKLVNALNGNIIDGAQVKLRKGWNNYTGDYVTNIFGKVLTENTDSSGEFSFTLPTGAYTAEIAKEGYVTGYYNVVSTLHVLSDEQKMVLTPILSDKEYRIILTWGEYPKDLDSHITYYDGSIQKMHVYYSNKSDKYNGKISADLDLDDTTAYGPETITLIVDEDSLNDGVFKYSVHNFSGRNSTNSYDLSLSDAVIHVYKGNTLLRKLNVPKNREGNVWHVFDISKDGVIICNNFYSESSGINIK